MKKFISLNQYEGNIYSLSEYLSGLGSDNKKEIEALKKAMLRAIDCELSERQALILKKYYFGGEGISDIAASLGVNKSTVSRSLKCSVKRLRHALNYASYVLSIIRDG